MIYRFKSRRTLKDIRNWIEPYELLKLMEEREQVWRKHVLSHRWYSPKKLGYYWIRDTSLVAITYLSASRISEVLRIEKDMIVEKPDHYLIEGVLLAKRIYQDIYDEDGNLIRRKSDVLYREIILPKEGERKILTDIFMKWVELSPYHQLYPFTRQRAWQIINLLTGYPPHWWRAFGENYLYQMWNFDLMAVADYVKVNPAILGQYLRGRYKKYKPV